MRYDIKRHLQYNVWATNKIAEALALLNEDLWDKEVVSSFPSVRKTVFHIWDAEQIWIKRIQDESPADWPSKNFAGTTADIIKGFTESSSSVAAFIEGQPESFWDKIFTYKNMKGVEFSTRPDEMLYHLVNHATFHRGQLVTMLRQLGVTQFAQQDLIAYVRQL
ncbi:MAG: DinB family protein [Chitinophagales bacterium]